MTAMRKVGRVGGQLSCHCLYLTKEKRTFAIKHSVVADLFFIFLFSFFSSLKFFLCFFDVAKVVL